MADPTLLFCVGATKAGTSWLYRYLHDHPSCELRAVKEAHYFDTFEAEPQEQQIAAFQQRLAEMRSAKADAQANDIGWKVKNMTRRIGEMEGLIDVLGENRRDDLAYTAWLMKDAEDAALVADMTPSYASLPDYRLNRMLRMSPTTKFVYLLRDPIDRLWSHARMQAKRFKQTDEDYAKKANNILWRVVNKGAETHITERGDYPATVERLRKIVPPGRLLVQFMEDLFTPAGLAKMCDFLGIPHHPADAARVHAGDDVAMRDDLRPLVAKFLQNQYDWVATHVGPVPDHWQNNLKRAQL